MKTMFKSVLIIAFLGIGIAVIGRLFIDSNEQPPYALEKDIPQTLDSRAMDQLLAEDLSITTSMFLDQLSTQLNSWAEQDFSDTQLIEKSQLEIKEHPHINGFIIFDNQNIEQEIGDIINPDFSLLTHTHLKSEFSDPFSKDGKNYMLMGEKLSDNRKILAEVDLSFIQSFVMGMASVADANGSFFVSGDDPTVQWETTNDVPNGFRSQTVPELGWQIVVHSNEHKPEENQKSYIENQVVIKFKDHEKATDWLQEHAELQVVKENLPYYVVSSPNETTEQLLERLQNDFSLAFTEPIYLFNKQGLTKPNDEFFEPYQWNLEQINTSGGWDLSGGNNITIAILDTGVDPNHADLKDKIKTGYNAFDESDDFSDAHGHGTHVAGVAAAMTNNVTGIAGISWNSTILPVKVLNDEGEGSSYDVAKGIYWAVDQGAKVINMSLGDYYDSEILYDAIKYAYDRDVVIVVASGNDNVEDPMYPAQYSEVLTVAAVDQNKNRAFFSNYGNHVDISAPGEHIPSLFINNEYTVMSGTSMASPHVAGLAGLVRSLRPDLSNQEVYDVITSSADDLGTKGKDAYYGHGQINIEKALQSISE
ncbi:putative extracellular serine protease [Bacillus sp. TS-2]|nr:putative extracellular serine protease [Bacillus sp. TS-2]